MKDTGYKPANDTMRRRFIAYKLGRISKKYIDNMTHERKALLDSIKQIDQNIQSTEDLLSSLLPNISRMMQAKQEKKMEKAKQNQKTIELSNFWEEKKRLALQRNDKDCPICFYRL